MTWSDERVELLKQFWADGLSASQIAKKLGGVTRNAVIGKVHRLGLSGRATPARPERGRAPIRTLRPAPLEVEPAAAPTPRPVPRQVYPEPALVEALTLQSGEKATIPTLKSGMCKWPIGDPSSDDFHFCGRPGEPGKPYCEHHMKLAYQPAQKRERAPREKNEEVAYVPLRERRLARG